MCSGDDRHMCTLRIREAVDLMSSFVLFRVACVRVPAAGPGLLKLVIGSDTQLSTVCAVCLLLRQVKAEMLQGGADTGFAKIEQDNPWLASTPLVVKPDQLIKRRGKAGLLAVNKTWPEVQAWISERMGKSQEVCRTT